MTSEFRIEAAAQRCVTFRHLAAGCERREGRETELRITAPDRATLERLRGIEIGDERIALAPAAGRVRHAGRHSDPFYIVTDPDGAHLSVICYEPSAPTAAGDLICLRHADGHAQNVRIAARTDGLPEPDALDSRLVRGDRGWRLEVAACRPFELIRQILRWGRYEERRTRHPAGRHSFPVGPAHADSLGLALSTEAMLGGLEHKHMIFGHLGLGSGRYLIAGRPPIAIPPKLDAAYAYRAGLVAWRPGILAEAAAILAGFDELELFVPEAARSTAAQELDATGLSARITCLGGAGADLAVAGPDGADPPGAGPASLMLFADSAAPDFAAHLASLPRRLARLPATRPVLERGWLEAAAGILPDEPAALGPRYGAGFCFPHEAGALSDTDLRRALARDRARRLAAPCATCPVFEPCAGALPFPWPGRRQPAVIAADGACRLQRTLQDA